MRHTRAGGYAAPQSNRRLFLEAAHRSGFGVEDLEDGQQPRDLQHFLKLRAQVGELQRRALGAGAMMRSHERAQAGAVNVGDVAHVQDDILLVLRQQLLHVLAEGVAFLTQHDAALERQDGHSLHLTARDLQCHANLLSIDPSNAKIPAAAWASPRSNSSQSRTYNTRTPGKPACTFARPAAANTPGSSSKRVPERAGCCQGEATREVPVRSWPSFDGPKVIAQPGVQGEEVRRPDAAPAPLRPPGSTMVQRETLLRHLVE